MIRIADLGFEGVMKAVKSGGFKELKQIQKQLFDEQQTMMWSNGQINQAIDAVSNELSKVATKELFAELIDFLF